VKLYQFLAVGLLLPAISACSEEPAKTEAGSTSAQVVNAIETAEPPIAEPLRDDVPQIVEVFNVGATVYVRSLAIEAASNRLWVGTSLGVNEIDLENNSLVNTFTRDHGLANEYIFGIGIDADGYKWFGTNAGGWAR